MAKDKIKIVWTVEDVFEIRPDLSTLRAREVLKVAKDNHDATVGINWDVLGYWAEYLYPTLPSLMGCEEPIEYSI